MATDLAGPGYHINRSNLLVLEGKADMQKRGEASPDDGDALALIFAQTVAPAEVEDRDDDREVFGSVVVFRLQSAFTCTARKAGRPQAVMQHGTANSDLSFR